MTQFRDEDIRWMRRCLELAAHGAGYVSPNPLVGAVLVGAGGDVLGEGWHGHFGGSHAEVHAVRDALRSHETSALKEATLYINLEPCNHEGKTPPCTDLIIEHSIRRVVVGVKDPNPLVNGSGIERLREAGIDVVTDVLKPECFRLNEAFFHFTRTGRPLVTLKMAQTLDGRIASTTGDSRWISCEESRKLVHKWRSEIDGVLIGSGTAEVDDPALTVRHVDGRQPQRFVLDRNGKLPPSLRLFSDEFADHTTAIVVGWAHPSYETTLTERGGRILRAPEPAMPEMDPPLDLDPPFTLDGMLRTILLSGPSDGRHVHSLLVEGGARLATELFRDNLVDRFYLFIAPKVLGEGVPSLHDLGIDRMEGALTFEEHRWENVGDDMLFRGYRKSLQCTNEAWQ